MTKPLRYDSSINFRLSKSLHEAFVEAAGGQDNVHPRLRALIGQYVEKRQRERGKSLRLGSPSASSASKPCQADLANETGVEPAS